MDEGRDMKRIMLLLLCSIFLSCASTMKFEDTMNSYIGTSIYDFEVIVRQGAKTMYNLENDNTVRVYRILNVMMPILEKKGLRSSSSKGLTEICTIRIETNREGEIVRWEPSGSVCKL